MDNPYESSVETPVLPAEDRMRWSDWLALFLAYGVHHAASIAGLLTGVMIWPDMWAEPLPRMSPVMRVVNLALIPMWDVTIVVETLDAKADMPEAIVWSVRCLAMLTIPFAILAYGASRRSAYLWYLGIVSFLIYVSISYTLSS